MFKTWQFTKATSQFLLISVLLCGTIFFSQQFLSGTYHLFKFFEFSFIGFYTAKRVTAMKQVYKVIISLAIGAVFESLLAILQFLNQGSLNNFFYFFGERMYTGTTPGIANAAINGQLILRPYGTFPHPNVLAGFLLSVMVLVFWAFGLAKKNQEKFFFATSLLLGTIALFLTMSRIAMLLWIVILVVSLARLQIKDLRKKYIMVGGFLCLGVVLLSTPFGNRLLATRLTEEAVVQRQALIASSIKLFSQHPVLGVGLGNFLPAQSLVQKPLALGFYLQPVHNIFLLVLSETGILGFGVFMWFLIKTYRHLFDYKKTHGVFLLLLTSLIILGLFDHYLLTIQQGQLLFSISLGLSWTTLDQRA